jgi:Flp pilus assembly protein TadG
MKRIQQMPGVLTSRRPAHRRRGSTLIEFALIVPILIVMLLGIIEFGWLVKNHLTVANATREGARVASLGKTIPEIQARIKSSAQPIDSNTLTITLERSGDKGATYTGFPADNTSVDPDENGVQSGDLIRVTVKVPHTSLTNLPFMSNKVIEVAVTMVREKENGP